MNNCHVTTTQDGDECLEIYRQELQWAKSKSDGSNNPFDVVVLDYKMPRKNGLEAAKEILALNPHQRIIFASAYAEGTIADSIRQLGKVVEVIQKPFKIKMLVELIKNKKIHASLKNINEGVRIVTGIKATDE